ncbi:unnamed protein product [Orchesella dallaii]|uniref:F-box domain-containing protein n=1 Tax=Orchesella dallaii TaxID=48710 RepID=A0ABP1QJR4_9HEXA
MSETERTSCKAMDKENIKQGVEQSDSNISNIFCLMPEIWETILSRLSSTDFSSLINTTLYWNSEFSDQKTRALLPLVVPVLINNSPLEAMLPLRTASSQTKLDVDKEMEAMAFSLDAYWAMIINEEGRIGLTERPTAHRLFTAAKFHSAADLTELFTRVLTEENPFKMRSIHVNINIINDQFDLAQQELWSLLSLLEKFGTYTRILRCHIEALSSTNSKILHLASLLETTPNLKVLSICGNFRNQNGSLDHPFPKMPHLELLDLEKYWFGDWAPREDGIDMFLLQNYGRQLKAFMCDGAFLDYAGSRLNHLVPKISKLRLVKVNLSCLLKLRQLDFPLEEIQFIKYQKYDAKTNESLRLGHFVRAVSKFSSLIHLALHVNLNSPLRNDLENIEPHYMEPFPELMSFTTKLSNVDTPWFWPFVQTKFPHLKVLILQISKMNLVVEDSLVVEAEKGFKLLKKLEKVFILCDGKQVASSYKIVITKDRSARIVRQ